MFLFRRILSIALKVLTTIACLTLLASAWAGSVDPRHFPLAAVLAMVVPIAAVAVTVLLVADLLWSRLAAILAGLTLAVTAPVLLDNFPIHAPGGKSVPEGMADSTWTLLTYNVYDFEDISGRYDGNLNPTLSYIIAADADVVCLQEAEYFSPLKKFHVGRAQLDTLADMYPHILLDGKGQCLLSKFPATQVRTSFNADTPGNGNIAAYVLNIRGHRVALFNVHLQSIGLTADDKSMYRNITSLKGGTNVREVKGQLLDKLSAAASVRAEQTEFLVRDINKFGGENVVVCGDFNDVPGCWSLRRLSDLQLHEVYPQVGLGYMRTYNLNRFYFRIDHILYRGSFRPLSLRRGNLKSSDHYPQLVTFLFDGEAADTSSSSQK